MATTKPNSSIEGELAVRLLAALERCDVREIDLLQGRIFGLHSAKLSLFVASQLASRPAVHAEEVFSETSTKAFRALQIPAKIRDVGPDESFGRLFYKIARDEVNNYWRGRPPYGDDRRVTPGVEAWMLDDRHRADPIEELHAHESQAERVTEILGAVGGVIGLDGLLLQLTVVAELSLPEVERLLELAEADDQDAAAADASAFLGATPEIAGQYLTLIRECPSARVMSYNALKVAVHRARNRANVANRPDPTQP